MSSSGYPMLDGKPIDKLKVTELREELKKRSLPTKGLKEELIRRLAAAIQEAEREEEEEANQESEKEEEEEEANDEAEEDNEANKEAEITPVAPIEAVLSTETTPVVADTAQESTETGKATAEASDGVETVIEAASDVEITPTPQPPVLLSKPVDDAVTKGSEQDEKVDDVRDISGNEETSEPVIEKSEVEVDEKSCAANDAKKNEQVSSDEVKPVTGTEVTKKSDCISTDSVVVSNNEKIELELKDNEIADDNDVKLDQQNVSKSQLQEQSHPMDVEEPLESQQKKKKISVGENSSVVNAGGDSEKLNLDRSSSGDESMEDEPETKQNESVTSDEVVNNNKSEKTEMVIDAKEVETQTRAADVIGAKKGGEEEAPANKRKLSTNNDQEAVRNNEPVKRQRRWNSESVKVPEATNNAAAAATPTTVTPRSAGMKRDFARSDSSVSEDGPKERVVPPSPKEPTNSLRIDRFLRPFTLKAVQELLGKTGKVTNFWMDHIKTHCYVSYASVEEAAATREAVYNLQWPPNGGRLLIAEFVGETEVKAKLEAPLPPPPPPPTTQTQAQAQPQALPPPPPLVKPAQVIERLPPPPPLPPPVEELEAPIVTLDDLFKKTKAIPRIYYLPLSEEQVAAKLAAKNNNK